MLCQTPRLEPVDLQILNQVNVLRDQLRHAVQQAPMKWTLDLGKALTASAIAASNTIEGYQVDAKDVADLMDGEREVDTSDENKAETLAYQQAMSYIQSLHDVADFRYSKELLNSLHWMLQGHHHPLRTAGQWRKTSIRITAPGDELATDYEGPDHELLPGLMSELVHWLNDGDLDSHVLVRAAMAHLNLVKIHPWSDGNGRMSRSLQTLLIARGGVLAPEFSSIEEWLGMPGNTWDYYKVLREVGGPVFSPERDTLAWIKFNLLAYHQQTQRVQRRVDRSNDCWMQLIDAAPVYRLTERQLTALHEVAMVGRVRRSRYEKAEALNTQQANRDLQALTKAELLTAVGQTKGRHYIAGPRFPQNVLATAQRPHTIVNPYAT
ncbi:Fic family protein [Streptomyces sp. NBC_01167]|uniref:Fic family protein n=1 Tax=Streptomyces sp. NBC_01167 TaxID=2903756 RepID=UPI003863BB27|nr:Fic family protein [Streptomyces sp. NBC_01167]